MAFDRFHESHPLGIDRLQSGRASDHLNCKRLTALNYSVEKDAIEVDERTA
jgi:hypothetical protein